MIDESRLPELQAYRELEPHIMPLSYSTSYAELVASADQDAPSVHRWFHFKEAFSPRLLPQILSSLDLRIHREFTLLDPFCGVGTSLLAAEELESYGYHINATGIEVNPFIHFAAQTKLSWRSISEGELVAL